MTGLLDRFKTKAGGSMILLALLLCIALDWKFEDLFYFTEAPEKKKRYF